MTRRVLVSPQLTALRSGNPELDRWVEQYLQAFVSQVFEQIQFLTPETESFTPVLYGSGTAGTYELASSNCWYYRVGDLVFAHVEFTLAGAITGGGTGTALISGLPFEKIEADNSIWTASPRGVDLSGHQVVVNMNSTTETPTLHINEVQDNADINGLAIGSFAVNDIFSATGFYRTNGERTA